MTLWGPCSPVDNKNAYWKVWPIATCRVISLCILALPGVSMESNASLLSSCNINTWLHLILVECTYPLHTIAAGFQVIARAPDYSQTHKLYSSKAVSPQRQVAIPVHEDGLYQVTVLGIRRGAGILQSDVE